ncbi:hypothetical protein GFS31_23360 [Leptolyngbya sp. BL0902]|uniref:DUF502 domain-containing protein n=1 Tax=Leptolyngbya sp. BL0902 TaxID=1115757 RepID=UPI0018E7BE09|nr:DUF502 domain-containing protein [Leptolyngbya sp. BL0902]QQE65648.1 hypothetical protein GFS31_23360 [Leptolyngbya sp. BL0902]
MDLESSPTLSAAAHSGSERHELPVLQKLKQDLKNDLIAGLLVIIPLATTIWLTITIANWVIRLLTRFPKQLAPFDGLHPLLVDLINLSIGLAVPLSAILLIGLMARNIAGRWLLDLGERTVQSIPLAGSVYKTLQQLLQTVFQDSKTRFRRVVLVEYPRKGIWAIAFVTGAMSAATATTPKMLSVFVPTTPNPTSGWYAVVPETDVINLAISIEDAFKVLLSGGIVGPNLAAAVPPERIATLAMPTLAPDDLAPAPLSLGQVGSAVADTDQQLSVFPLAEPQLSSVPLDEDC